MNRIQFYLITAIIPALASCGGDRHNSDYHIKTVHTVTVTDENEESSLTYIGKVVPAKELSLSFKVGGKISRIYVKQGSVVKSGQLIAELDPVDYQNQFMATEAEYRQIKAEADRIIAMHDDGAVSDNNYDKAVYGLNQITAKYKQHKSELSDTKLYAPFSGKIDNVLAETGEVVNAGMPIAMMIDAGTPEIEIYVPQTVLPLIHGKKPKASFQSLKLDDMPATVLSVSPTANANQLYTVKLGIPSDINGIIPGMTAVVDIPRAAQKGGLRIPQGAVTNNYVLRFNPTDSTVSKIVVHTEKLLSNGECIIQSDELNPGDILISSGMNHIAEGEKVRPVAPVSETNKGGLL